MEYFFPELLNTQKTCPVHSFKHLEESSKLLHLSSKMNFSGLLESFIKSRENYKKELELSGKLFWLSLNYQYFPYITLKTLSSPCLPKPLRVSSMEKTWISSQILSLESEYEKVSSLVTSMKNSISSSLKTYSKNPKLGENLLNSFRLPMNLYGKLVRNYEKTKIKAFSYVAKDYSNFQSEDKIVCAVCDSGESVDENLIVICSGCNIPVHSECYCIKNIPEDDWLCEPCTRSCKLAQCFLCPVRAGALKQAGDSWVHVTCGRYLQTKCPENGFFDFRKIDQNKFKLRCFSCGLKTGACVQCSCGRCANAFHVECRKDLIEVTPTGINWLCPSHKASKLTRIVKLKQDLSLDYIKQAAMFVWNQSFQQLEKKKKKIAKKNKNSEKKKLVVQVCGSSVLLKSFLGNRLQNVLRFVQDKNWNGQGRLENFESCFGMNCKVLEQNKEVFIQGDKGDIEITIQMPKKNCGIKLRKKRKIFE
jgi:hypothetical protein